MHKHNTPENKKPAEAQAWRVLAGFCYCLKPFFGGIGAIESSLETAPAMGLRSSSFPDTSKCTSIRQGLNLKPLGFSRLRHT
jgi:hypothetical protein